MRLIFLGNDPVLGVPLTHFLEQEGHVIDWIQEVPALRPLLSSRPYHCLLLDLAARPDKGGELLRDTRRRCPEIASVVIAQMSTSSVRAALLDHGADDVMDRPVDLHELSARIRRLARRNGAADLPGRPPGLGPLRLEMDRRHVSWHDRPVALTRKEYCLLELLVNGRGRIYTRAEIAEVLYRQDRDVVSNTIEVHVHNLRRKLTPMAIASVHGVGYKPGPALFDA